MRSPTRDDAREIDRRAIEALNPVAARDHVDVFAAVHVLGIGALTQGHAVPRSRVGRS
jgi:hypothetical protein